MLSFKEKRELQKLILAQNQILAGNPSFSEKRAAQKAKLDALTKLGAVGKSYAEKLADLQERRDPDGIETNTDPAVIQPSGENSELQLNENPAVEGDFGLKSGGIKTRERINSQVADIVAQVKAGKDPKTLNGEEIELLRQYSGKGGLTENSQYE